MPTEYLAGRYQLDPPEVVKSSGGYLSAGSVSLFLSGRNRAGYTVLSDRVDVNYSASQKLTVTLPASNYGSGCDFHYFILSAAPIGAPSTEAVQIARWDYYQSDQISLRDIEPIAIERSQHLDLNFSVATPNDLPNGNNLLHGCTALVISLGSYYLYDRFRISAGEDDLTLSSGDIWHKIGSPLTGLLSSSTDVGGALAPVVSIDPNLVLLPPSYPGDGSLGFGVKLVWRNSSANPIPAGTRFALEVKISNEIRTIAFNGRLILTFRGIVNYENSYLNSSGDWVDIPVPYLFDPLSEDIQQVLTLPQPLEFNHGYIIEVAPQFVSEDLDAVSFGAIASVYFYPLSISGSYQGTLHQLTGNFIFRSKDRAIPVPLSNLGVRLLSGSALLSGYSIDIPEDDLTLQSGVTETSLIIDTNGRARLGDSPNAAEAIRANIFAGAGRSDLGYLGEIALSSAGGISIELTFPKDSENNCVLLPEEFAPQEGAFLPSEFDVLISNSAGDFFSAGRFSVPALGNSTISIDQLGLATPFFDPDFPNFYPFPNGTTISAGTGTIDSGTYKIWICYVFPGDRISYIDLSPMAVAPDSLISDLSAASFWSAPVEPLAISNISPLVPYQSRQAKGLGLIYYDPLSTEDADGATVWLPEGISPSLPGRWLLVETSDSGSGSGGGSGEIADGSATDIKIGDRAAVDTIAPDGLGAYSLTGWLSRLVNRIKAILGTSNWYDAPPVTLSATSAHISSLSNPHSVTAAQVGSATAQWNANSLQSRAVAATAPTTGQVLTWNASISSWTPQSISSSGVLPDATASVKGILQLAGDLGGVASSPTVATSAIAKWNANKLQGRNIAIAAPESNQALVWNADDSSWTPTTVATGLPPDASSSSKGLIQLSGDLGGVAASPIVTTSEIAKWNANKLQGLTVAAITPNNNQALVWSSAATSWVPATIASSGAVPDATAGSKGLIQLAGDLAGTASNPVLSSTGAIAGTYSNATITIDGRGRIFAASSGSNPGGGSSANLTRQSLTYNSPIVPNNGYHYGEIALGKSFVLFFMQANVPCWIRFYATTNARTADQRRELYQPGSLQSGLIHEAIFNSSSLLVYSFVVGASTDVPLSSGIPVLIQNLAGYATNLQIALTFVSLEN